MSILYAFIARDNSIVLTEYTEYSGNFQQISRILLKKIEINTNKTLDYEKYKYHYINEANITYMCMTDNFPDNLAFAFLTDIKKSFISTYEYEKISAFSSYALTDFIPVIKNLIQYYNQCPLKTKEGETIQELVTCKSVTIENVERLFSREEKLDIIAIKSATLNTQSKNINFIADQIKKQARKKQIRTILMIAGVIFICVLFIIFLLF